MKALITTKNGTYYVGKKSGKNFTYTEVKPETLVTVDKNGKISVKTTVGGKAIPASTVLYEATEDGFNKCKVEDVSIVVNWSLDGHILVNVSSYIHVSEDGIATIDGHDNDGNCVSRQLPAGTYAVLCFDEEDDARLDLAFPADTDFHPADSSWDEFLANDPCRIIPKPGPEKKALDILKAAFDKVKALGLRAVVDDDDHMFVIPEDADWIVNRDDNVDDVYNIEVPIRAFNFIHTGIAHVSTYDDYSMYLRSTKSDDEDTNEDTDE